jgi:hypothetical protein
MTLTLVTGMNQYTILSIIKVFTNLLATYILYVNKLVSFFNISLMMIMIEAIIAFLCFQKHGRLYKIVKI